MKSTRYAFERLEIPNPSVIDSAEQFYEGARILRNQPPLSGVLLPMVTNAVLSLELYIKSLNMRSVIQDYQHYGNEVYGGVVSELPFSRSHKLSNILNSVIDDVKYNIDTLHQQGSINHSYSQLIELVKKYDDLFVQVRYSYENKVMSGFNISELFDCIDIIRDVINKIEPIDRVII